MLKIRGDEWRIFLLHTLADYSIVIVSISMEGMARMAKQTKKNPERSFKYEKVLLADLKHGREGKHHDLMDGIFDEIATLEVGSALKIPLSGVDGVTLANLRSAVHRKAASKKFEVETVADRDNFYVWKRNGNGSNGDHSSEN